MAGFVSRWLERVIGHMSSLMPAFQTYAKELNFELVAVCDIWKKRREEVPGQIGAEVWHHHASRGAEYGRAL
jgi:hypothetical protein